MAESFLLVRLGSMGDIIHALPAAAALRDTFPDARIDWAVEPRWTRLLKGNPDINAVVTANRKSFRGAMGTLKAVRGPKYTCAIDFQALYKSALLAFASGASRRIGFTSNYAREGLASIFYTEHLNPRGPHKVDHNLTLAMAAGAEQPQPARFPLAIDLEDDEAVSRELAGRGIREFFVVNPGGGWLSKCWPAERYGELSRKLAVRFGWRGIVTAGPGEENLASDVVRMAGDPPVVALLLPLGALMALMQRARFVVSADTGPLHLASALGAPVIGLYGPTDPARNGPYSCGDIAVRNPHASVTTYRREASYSTSMLSITVDQVLDAIERRLERRA
ncbi:MAG TPA: glycosyltransferase family 9 protein [Candidatus Acidoferrum sp.]|nr:glycosyltransferase family 9 protein [Candidatus Acidoferrum sp.]